MARRSAPALSKRALAFLNALGALSAERPRTPGFTMNVLAERLGLSWDDTARAALACYDARPPLVDIAGKAYSVTLLEAGRRALAGKRHGR